MSEYIDKLFLSGQEIPIQDSKAQEKINELSDKQDHLKSAVQNGPCYNVLAKYHGKYSSKSSGVTITYVNDGGIRIQGTATAVSWANIYMDSRELPDGFIPGKRYYITYSASRAYFIIYRYPASGSLENLLETKSYNDYWEAPQSMAGAGMIARIWLASGHTYDETVYPAIFTEKPNSVLAGEIENNSSAVARDHLFIDSLARYSSLNLLDLENKNSRTMAGITFDWLPDGTCHVHGTAAGTAFANIYISQTALPDWLDKATPYEINSLSKNVYLYVYDYSLDSPNVIGYSHNALPETITIPNSCTGIIIRLWVASGTVVDEIVTATMMKTGRNLDHMPSYVGDAGCYTDSANNIDRNCSVFVSLMNGLPNIADVPYAAAWLDTYIISNMLRIQRITPYESQKHPVMIRTKEFSGWKPWIAVGQTGYVQAVDTASADETGKTDMRPAIQYALDAYGFCKLGPGVYYISSKIVMPEGSTLEGCGEATELRLMSGDAMVAVLMRKNSTVNHLSIIGSYTDLMRSDFGLSNGSRYGIQYYKADGETCTTAYCSVTNVHIRNFSGAGIYQYNTGANVEQGLFVSNVHIKNCWCGVWAHSNSEFCRYDNIQITYCYIACINNGGNNAFNNCIFHAYSIGMKIEGEHRNSAHGMCSNSSFCHTGDNAGSALTLGNIVSGYVFSACQFWYNSVDITNCGGIVFSGCEFGRGTTGKGATINVDGGNTILFGNCVFMNDETYQPDITITNNNKVKFNGCYGSVSGNEITA